MAAYNKSYPTCKRSSSYSSFKKLVTIYYSYLIHAARPSHNALLSILRMMYNRQGFFQGGAGGSIRPPSEAGCPPLERPTSYILILNCI